MRYAVLDFELPTAYCILPTVMHISIIGTGYVGLVTGACLASKGHEVVCVDIDESKIDALNRGLIPIYEPGLDEIVKSSIENGHLKFTTSVEEGIPEAQVVFLAVGTPPKEDGSADLTYVFQAVDDIAPHLSESCVVVSKSTVPVGTNSRIKAQLEQLRHPERSEGSARVDSSAVFQNDKGEVFVASNPEFLREGMAISDFLSPDRIVIGTDASEALITLKEVYKDFDCPILETSIESAEMIKYASNAFLATKISFINEIANICEGVGADVKDVSKGMGLDPRIGQAWLNAGVGYGGSCFPKDVRALDQIATINNYDFKLLKSVIQVNNEQRWRFYKKIQNELGDLGDKKIAILGLAFKAGTDDVRESIGVDFAKKMIRDGVQVSVYDPQAMDNARQILDNVEFSDSIESAIQGSDAIVITTEWDEFINFDFSKVADQMNRKIIFDGRNILPRKKIENQGFKYFGIGC